MVQTREKTSDGSCQLSVVIPVYQSHDCLPELLLRLHLSLGFQGQNYEIILVDDASQDNSWNTIVAQSQINPLIRGIHRQQNGGKDRAIWDGLQIALGKAIVIMDDDLQHDPQDIIPLCQKIQSGYDLCYAIYSKNQQSWLKNTGSWLHGKIASYCGNKSPNLYLSPFKSLNRKLLKKIILSSHSYPYLDGLCLSHTQNIGTLSVIQSPRYAGKGHYGIRASLLILWQRLKTWCL